MLGFILKYANPIREYVSELYDTSKQKGANRQETLKFIKTGGFYESLRKIFIHTLIF
jgi:hypothetical protein